MSNAKREGIYTIYKRKEEKMRNLKYAILGLLLKSDMSGYDISQAFDTTLCEFWSAKHSQIYPELKRLTEEGMIEYRVEKCGKVLEKKMYAITERGREDFYAWLSAETQLIAVPKDLFRLKLFFIDDLPEEDRVRLLKHQLEQYEERLGHFYAVLEKFPEPPSKDSEEIGEYLILKGSVCRIEAVCGWLRECIKVFGE